MIENEKQEQEQEQEEVTCETENESRLEYDQAPKIGRVTSYIREERYQDRSSGHLDYVMSALDFITCGKCKTTYVKGDEHDC
jgi:hypothetical protein